MNWAYRFMCATPGVEQWVAAPWKIHNGYENAFRFFPHPLQTGLNFFPDNEWAHARFAGVLLRLEKYGPLYRHWLEKKLKRERPDVLHAHFGPVGCHYAAMAQRLDIPLMVSFYGYDFKRTLFQKPVLREKYRRLFEVAARLTATGTNSAEWLVQLGAAPEKIISLPLGVSTDDFAFHHRHKIPGQLRLLQVATFTDKKGHLDTLAAFQLALQNCPNLQLTLAGERQDRALFSAIKTFIRSHRLEQKVRLLDFIPHARLPVLMREADLFIHPSRTSALQDVEGSPVVIAEAQATGLPVISTRHADIPMLVLHEKTGLLAPERSPEILAGYIKHFYQMDHSAYQSCAQAARRQITEHFSVEKTGERLLACYQSMVTNIPKKKAV
ncbi:MAG: glycosyltransferase [Saprospiraceae bacterium]|nr:glycosyltransferase [Saprospiraceae bacterium]